MTVKPASLFTKPYFHSHFGSDKVIMAVAMTSIHMYIYTSVLSNDMADRTQHMIH